MDTLSGPEATTCGALDQHCVFADRSRGYEMVRVGRGVGGATDAGYRVVLLGGWCLFVGCLRTV